jgi:hypothetical protein
MAEVRRCSGPCIVRVMDRAARRAIGGSSVALVLAGCSAIATFDNLVASGPGDMGDGGEGGASSTDGSASMQSDGGGTRDGAPGTGTDGDTSKPFCAGGGASVLLCDDFESGMLDPSRWRSPNTKGPGTIECSMDTAVSGSTSLKTSTKQHNYGEYYQSVESNDLPVSTATFRLEVAFNMTMDVNNTSDGTSETLVDLGTDNGGDLWIGFDKTSMWAGTNTWFTDAGQSPSYDSDLGMAPPQDGWHTMQIDVTFGQSSGFTVSIDGKKVGSGTGLRAVTAPPSLVHVYLGIDNNGRVGDTKAYFDNVRVSTLPSAIP